jgi:hypothetical protein
VMVCANNYATAIPGAFTAQGPSTLTAPDGRAVVAWQRSSDSKILYSILTNNTWSTPTEIPGATTTLTAPCMINFSGSTFCLHRGYTNNNIYQRISPQ